jgi:hypothetical protein
MTAKPLNWISWREARQRMPKIWDRWAYFPDRADRAMMNTLRRGHVLCRGEGIILFGNHGDKTVEINEILPELRGISFAGESVAVRYVQRASPPPLHPPQCYYTVEADLGQIVSSIESMTTSPAAPFPVCDTVKATARFVAPELVWDEFRDELIRFELPADASSNDTAAPAEPRRRGNYKGELTAFMGSLNPKLLAQLSDDDVAQRFEDRVHALIKKGLSVLKLPQRRHIANQVSKLRPKYPAAP